MSSLAIFAGASIPWRPYLWGHSLWRGSTHHLCHLGDSIQLWRTLGTLFEDFLEGVQNWSISSTLGMLSLA